MSNILETMDTNRVLDLRTRVRDAMDIDPVYWTGSNAIEETHMSAPIAVRKARAVALKLSEMPVDLWDGQLIAGSMTLEKPRLHAEKWFPEYLTNAELEDAKSKGLGTGCFGHIVPDYPRLLKRGLSGIRQDAECARNDAENEEEAAFLESVTIAIDGVIDFAARLSRQCRTQAESLAIGASETNDSEPTGRAGELEAMAADLERVPSGPARSFRQALQSVWLLHMIFHSTKNNNALGRLDQYVWPNLEHDLENGVLDLSEAAELVDCFMLKFNERAKTTLEQHAEERKSETIDPAKRTRHATSSQIGSDRDGMDATNHWLQNIIVSGLTPDGEDGTNLLSHLIIRSFRSNGMTNPLVTVRIHHDTPVDVLSHACLSLKDGGGMPAFFNDEALVPAIQSIGISLCDARDYTNDGCWEVIIPGRTDFKFQRLSLMLCLEWALNRGRSRLTGRQESIDTGDPREFTSFDDVWRAFITHLDAMIGRTVARVVESRNERNRYAPVPLLSALIDGAVESRRDMTAGGARYRTFGMLAESAAHTIDSLTAIKTIVFGDRVDTEEGNGSKTRKDSIAISDLCDALEHNFEGYENIHKRLKRAPKYGNDDDTADSVGRRIIDAFTLLVKKHASEYDEQLMRFPCGVGTFSWYIGIGEGLGPSPDGRKSGNPVSSNFSPALGADMAGLPEAILSYSRMPHEDLPAGGPLDLRVSRKLVGGDEGTERLVGLVRSFCESGGAMMTLTVADTEELRAAQSDPESYRSLRVRMGGWCAYFTALSREQQDHQIRRQDG